MYLGWPKYLPYPTPLGPFPYRVQNQQSVDWATAQFAPESFPPGYPSVMNYQYPDYRRDVTPYPPNPTPIAIVPAPPGYGALELEAPPHSRRLARLMGRKTNVLDAFALLSETKGWGVPLWRRAPALPKLFSVLFGSGWRRRVPSRGVAIDLLRRKWAYLSQQIASLQPREFSGYGRYGVSLETDMPEYLAKQALPSYLPQKAAFLKKEKVPVVRLKPGQQMEDAFHQQIMAEAQPSGPPKFQASAPGQPGVPMGPPPARQGPPVRRGPPPPPWLRQGWIADLPRFHPYS